LALNGIGRSTLLIIADGVIGICRYGNAYLIDLLRRENEEPEREMARGALVNSKNRSIHVAAIYRHIKVA